jgi:hypothetical protein
MDVKLLTATYEIMVERTGGDLARLYHPGDVTGRAREFTSLELAEAYIERHWRTVYARYNPGHPIIVKRGGPGVPYND